MNKALHYPILLLALTCCNLPVAHAIWPLSGAPAALSDDEQCTTPGSCGANAAIDIDLVEYYYDATNQDYDYLHEIEPYPLDELSEALSSHGDTNGAITTIMQRHLERALLFSRFPSALETTMARAGNYTDGTLAGSKQWIGDEGVQDGEAPTYASFGSLLDISTLAAEPSLTWSGITEFGGKIPWIASLIYRELLVGELGALPCRVDLLDDYDDDGGDACLIGATLDNYVSVRGNEDMKREDMELAAEFDILDEGEFMAGNVMHINFGERKFDTIVANGVLAAVDADVDPTAARPMEDMDLVLEKLVSLLNPGGVVYLIGTEPLGEVDGPGKVYREVMNVFDSVKSLSGEYPKRNLSAKWINRKLSSLGLNVYTSTLFPVDHSYEDMAHTIDETREWLQDNVGSGVPHDVKSSYYKMLKELEARVKKATENGPVFAGEHTYIIAAEYNPQSQLAAATVTIPTTYQPKNYYKKDIKPTVELLTTTPLAPGQMEEYQWANNDPYDGFSARIGIPPELVAVTTEYIKKLGLWDLMIDTIYNDPMEPDSTRFYNLTSPFGDGGRNVTWGAKRPGNFYGSDSDMHWFDISDEAAHEDTLRALAKGGYDDVLNAIGNYLGLDHLVTFSIGVLAVTKADKGYVHVDFQDSGKRAFNFLFNLQTPSDDPELTVIEEDVLGNRRRGQVKYQPNFGVLNGDDGMHATNECNHRAKGGVRITVSIFISELQEESLEQVAGHDKYYFPFGNTDWIWAQRGRHWNKDGTVSLVNDKGRAPFEAEDEMEGCEEKVGLGKEKCLVNGPERKLCFKTCGTFMTEDKFRPGEERRKVFGW